MRFNPNATGPEPETASNELLPQVDTRQMSLRRCLDDGKHKVSVGAKRLTYFETIGRKGIIPGAHEPLGPGSFRSKKGMLANFAPVEQQVRINAWKQFYDVLFMDEENFDAFTFDSDFLRKADWKHLENTVSLKPCLAILK